MAEWIKCSERMPPKHVDVLIALSTGAVVVGYYFGGCWDWADTDDEDDEDADAMYWMPFPKHPGKDAR